MTPAQARRAALLEGRREARIMRLTKMAYWSLTAWRTGFACYVLLISSTLVDEPVQTFRVEWGPGKPV